ncbi:hypothetical protein M0802_011030 [Mischocyttarus mexicanus]|nr:hypothetical protein M0802_011030 [Mischocyttarus mexicanus]
MYYIERYPLVLLLITELTFTFWIRFIKLEFSQLNELLKSMLTTTIDSPQHKRIILMRNNRQNDSASADIHLTYKSNEDVIKIKKAKKVHMELIKCAKNINSAYGLHILLSVSTSTILITILSYNLYNNLITETYKPSAIISLIYWILFYVMKVIVISHLCATTVAELYINSIYFILHASNIGDIICDLYIPTTSKEFRAEISEFTVQLIQNPLSFTSCGFFHVDHSLIRNLIGSVTTYLVILIQVGNIPPQVFTENSIFS